MSTRRKTTGIVLAVLTLLALLQAPTMGGGQQGGQEQDPPEPLYIRLPSGDFREYCNNSWDVGSERWCDCMGATLDNLDDDYQWCEENPWILGQAYCDQLFADFQEWWDEC